MELRCWRQHTSPEVPQAVRTTANILPRRQAPRAFEGLASFLPMRQSFLLGELYFQRLQNVGKNLDLDFLANALAVFSSDTLRPRPSCLAFHPFMPRQYVMEAMGAWGTFLAKPVPMLYLDPAHLLSVSTDNQPS
ncbi:hypothetical protein FOTG_17314 [Fusarium oxysporum f. sp. vasinfectum 25433]|uniref:Uncharacterized protein n=1 Tax=Fusarium oxysporum f. sp. vasinfectum 25433 TaxID=1089449 RepID=X0KKW8_FUSOX|nr:hypothetical protein FOTG_17314 [Fusarium oxysporum f. sp. vasinfectum 25433]